MKWKLLLAGTAVVAGTVAVIKAMNNKKDVYVNRDCEEEFEEEEAPEMTEEELSEYYETLMT